MGCSSIGTLLITPLRTTHEPPSRVRFFIGFFCGSAAWPSQVSWFGGFPVEGQFAQFEIQQPDPGFRV